MLELSKDVNTLCQFLLIPALSYCSLLVIVPGKDIVLNGYRSRGLWEWSDRWNGETGALCGGCTPRARWHCQHCHVYTLLPWSHEVRPAGAERYEWLCGNTPSLESPLFLLLTHCKFVCILKTATCDFQYMNFMNLQVQKTKGTARQQTNQRIHVKWANVWKKHFCSLLSLLANQRQMWWFKLLIQNLWSSLEEEIYLVLDTETEEEKSFKWKTRKVMSITYFCTKDFIFWVRSHCEVCKNAVYCEHTQNHSKVYRWHSRSYITTQLSQQSQLLKWQQGITTDW